MARGSWLHIASVLVGALLAGQCARAGSAAAEGMTETYRAVPLGRGGELRILVDQRTGTTPSTAVLLFAGYPGILRLREENGTVAYDLAGNFLVRARRHLANAQLFTVLVDCPVDQWSACGDSYRTSPTHAADVADVIDVLRRDFGAEHVYIAGTSYGTLSSAFLARALAAGIDGSIHTSTLTDPGRDGHGAALATFDWSQAGTPQLFVHHREDPCPLSRYDAIAARAGDLPLIGVTGSDGVRGAACEAFTQDGFVGRERGVMRSIADWILRRHVAAPPAGDCPAGGLDDACRKVKVMP
jgi:pimeloyl-ACP methyl ester carboxylesterase